MYKESPLFIIEVNNFESYFIAHLSSASLESSQIISVGDLELTIAAMQSMPILMNITLAGLESSYFVRYFKGNASVMKDYQDSKSRLELCEYEELKMFHPISAYYLQECMLRDGVHIDLLTNNLLRLTSICVVNQSRYDLEDFKTFGTMEFMDEIMLGVERHIQETQQVDLNSFSDPLGVADLYAPVLRVPNLQRDEDIEIYERDFPKLGE